MIDKVGLKPNRALGTLNISARPNQIYASNMQRLADIRTGFAYFDLIFNVLPKTTPFDSSWCLYLLDWITRGSLNGWHWLEYHPLSDPRGIQILIIHTSTMVCIVAVPASLLKARCFSQVARGGSKAKGGGASEAATQNIVGYEYIQLQGKNPAFMCQIWANIEGSKNKTTKLGDDGCCLCT